MIETYCVINTQTNLCENLILWDGNTETWNPQSGYLAIKHQTLPTKVWEYNKSTKTWELVIQSGVADIGFSWDGQNLITSESMPTYTPVESLPNEPQPIALGTQTL